MKFSHSCRSLCGFAFYLSALAFSSGHAGPLGPVPEIRAVKIPAGRIHVDGRFDEAEWQQATPVTGFIQRTPWPGEKTTQDSEIRILYDSENLYISARMFNPHPEQILATQMKRDADVWETDDTLQIVIDPYHDHRNGYYFMTNPLGIRSDALFFEEGARFSQEWNAVWWSEGQITAEGWQVEIQIPFRSLRFAPRPGEHIWGINFAPTIRRKNEETLWSPLPIQDEGPWRLARAGHLTGLSDITPGRQLEIKPSLRVGYERRPSLGRPSWRLTPENGIEALSLDLKYGLSSNFTLDVTLNTDFAQVEVDKQQIDPRGFSLFFPEKRDFFLEASGYFDFGITEELQPFFSRQIGLVDGQPVPLLGGRVEYVFSTKMSLTALTQWNDLDNTAITNVRFRYEYQPNSEFFIAYTEGRQTSGSERGDRSLVVKLTYLFNL